MHVSPINSTYTMLPKQNFNGLIKDISAIPIIEKMSEGDKSEFEKIEKRLSKTKFWDLKISSIGNLFKDFKFSFIDKRNKQNIISDAIYPYDKDGDTIKFYSIVYGPENTSKNYIESLKFSSKKRVDEVFENYKKSFQMIIDKRFNITPIESLQAKETQLNMLEEASATLEEGHRQIPVITGFATKETVGNELHK